MEYILIAELDRDDFEPIGVPGSLNEAKHLAAKWVERSSPFAEWGEARMLVYQRQESGDYKLAHAWPIEKEVEMIPKISWRLNAKENPPTG